MKNNKEILQFVSEIIKASEEDENGEFLPLSSEEAERINIIANELRDALKIKFGKE